MRIVVFGASGRIGSVIVREALSRGHRVTAAVRSPQKVQTSHPHLEVIKARIDEVPSVVAAVSGHDAVVHAVGGLGHENPSISIDCMEPLTKGMMDAGVDRLFVVGTAGTLEVPAGGLRLNQPDFPEHLKVEAQAHSEVLAFLRATTTRRLRWTYFSPPAVIVPGKRTGRVKLGRDQLLFDEEGQSYISNEDYAAVAVDELESPKHIGLRFTAIAV